MKITVTLSFLFFGLVFSQTQIASNSLAVQTCTCLFSTENQISLNCLPSEYQGLSFQQLSNSTWCFCNSSLISIPNTCPLPVCPSWFWLQNFNIFALDSINVSSYASIDGRIGAVNDIYLTNFVVNYSPYGNLTTNSSIMDMACSSLGNNSFSAAILAGRNLWLNSGRVYSGNVVYGSQANLTSVNLSSSCQQIQNTSNFDFAGLNSNITLITQNLDALATNGVYSNQNGTLMMSGPSTLSTPYYVVFRIKVTDLIDVLSFQFSSIPTNTKAIIMNFDWSGLTIPADFAWSVPSAFSLINVNPTYRNMLVWNFKSLSATFNLNALTPNSGSYTQFYGLLLAPGVNLDFGANRVQFFGPVICKSFSGQNLMIEEESMDFCLADFLSLPTATPTMQTTTQPPTTQPTTVEVLTSVVPSVTILGTTKVPVPSSK